MKNTDLTIGKICERIQMPQEMSKWVCEFDERFNYHLVQEELDMLFAEDTREEGLERLRQVLGEDVNGVGMLSCMLRCALRSEKEYHKRGIPEHIYIETMKCFSRFVEEHRVSYGSYGFDRAFWTPRQLALKLFRIGELEYELWRWQGEKVVSIHIPSDARLLPEVLDQSLEEAGVFMQKFFPEYVGVKYVCDSWLLSPKLKDLLPPSSHIIQFQERFRVQSVDAEAMDVIEWVFQNAKCSIEELPEKTSLQRNMKAALLRGEKIGVAFGVLI